MIAKPCLASVHFKMNRCQKARRAMLHLEASPVSEEGRDLRCRERFKSSGLRPEEESLLLFFLATPPSRPTAHGWFLAFRTR